jgi:hypothetical protein
MLRGDTYVAVECKLCRQHVKRHAVLCEDCGLICHTRCAEFAPLPCDLRAQLMMYGRDYSPTSSQSPVLSVLPSPSPTSSPSSSAAFNFLLGKTKRTKTTSSACSTAGTDDGHVGSTPPPALSVAPSPVKRSIFPEFKLPKGLGKHSSRSGTPTAGRSSPLLNRPATAAAKDEVDGPNSPRSSSTPTTDDSLRSQASAAQRYSLGTTPPRSADLLGNAPASPAPVPPGNDPRSLLRSKSETQRRPETGESARSAKLTKRSPMALPRQRLVSKSVPFGIGDLSPGSGKKDRGRGNNNDYDDGEIEGAAEGKRSDCVVC